MSHRTTGALAATAALAVSLGCSMLGATTATAATEDSSSVPTYQQFRDSTFVDTDGQYVVNGDEPVSDSGKLRQFYDDMVGDKHTGRTMEDGLIVNTVSGKDDKWSASQVGNLTYCVSTKFGSDYSAMVSAMASGAGQWEAASSAIDFVHVPNQDSSCNTRNNSVLFSVEPVNTTQYIARAFFPSTPKRSRWSTTRSGPRGPGARPTSWPTSSGTPSASGTSTPARSRAPASRTTTGGH